MPRKTARGLLSRLSLSFGNFFGGSLAVIPVFSRRLPSAEKAKPRSRHQGESAGFGNHRNNLIAGVVIEKA
jgi:hypothetical protein